MLSTAQTNTLALALAIGLQGCPAKQTTTEPTPEPCSPSIEVVSSEVTAEGQTFEIQGTICPAE